MRRLIHLVVIAALLCICGVPAMMPCCATVQQAALHPSHSSAVQADGASADESSETHCQSHGMKHVDAHAQTLAPAALAAMQHCVGMACVDRAVRDGDTANQPSEQSAMVQLEPRPVSVASIAFHRTMLRPPSHQRSESSSTHLPLRI